MLKKICTTGYLLALTCMLTLSACNMDEPASDLDVFGTMSEFSAVSQGSIVEPSSSQPDIVSKAPAPDIWDLQVVAACSEQYDPSGSCESISSGAFSTNYDHGGAWMEIITGELGYRSFGNATMNGQPLTEIHNQYILDSSGAIIGYYRWWAATGQQSGTFTYEAYSINNGSRWTDSIYVR